jgi:uncharacterized membrane protein
MSEDVNLPEEESPSQELPDEAGLEEAVEGSVVSEEPRVAADASDHDRLMAEESKERAFQRYHAIQSLGFLVAAIVYEVVAALIYCGLTAATGGCLACVLWLVFLVPVVPALYYAYQAYQGLYFDIPFLTDFMVQSRWLERP